MKTKTSTVYVRKMFAAVLSVVGFFAFCVLAGESSEDATLLQFVTVKAVALAVVLAVVAVARKVFPDVWGDGNEA